jgi:hypothetical protein
MVVLLTHVLCPRKKHVSYLTSAARLACSEYLVQQYSWRTEARTAHNRCSGRPTQQAGARYVPPLCLVEGRHMAHVLDIIRIFFFGFYESFILFTKSAIFNCDSVFFFVHFCAS